MKILYESILGKPFTSLLQYAMLYFQAHNAYTTASPPPTNTTAYYAPVQKLTFNQKITKQDILFFITFITAFY